MSTIACGVNARVAYLLTPPDADIFEPPRSSFASTLSLWRGIVLALCRSSLIRGPTISKSAAQDGQNTSKVRHKSLVSFFGEVPTGSASMSSISQVVPTIVSAFQSKLNRAANVSKALIERVLGDTSSDPQRSKNASPVGVSDPVDVKMLLEEEGMNKAKSVKLTVRSV